MINKIQCRECGEQHKLRSDKFPRPFIVVKFYPNLNKSGENTPKREVVGYLCKKCQEKINLNKLKETIKRELNLPINTVVNKFHVADYIKKLQVEIKEKESEVKNE